MTLALEIESGTDYSAKEARAAEAKAARATEDDLRSHVRQLLALSGNLTLQTLSGFGIWLSTFIWIGTLGPVATGGCTLGNMLANITGFSLIFGMATALDSLCAQSYGAKQYQRCGLHTQRAILILTLFSLPCIAVWWQAEWILHNVLFIPSEIAFHAGRWTRTMSAGLWPLISFECLKKLMQARNIVWPAVLTTTIGLGFNLVANYYVFRIRKWGFNSAAWIVPIQNWVHFVVFVVILSLRKWMISRRRETSPSYDKLPEESGHGSAGAHAEIATATESKASHPSEPDPEDDWPPLSAAVFDDWKSFLELGVPGALSLFIEWGSFELAASIAGQLGAVGLAAHGIFMSTSGLFYMLPLSIAQATTTVAGHIIGQGAAVREDGGQAAARRIIMLGIAMDTIYGLVAAAVLMLVVRPVWGKIFTVDPATQELVTKTMPFMAMYAIVDATKCITLNILRSGGMPSITVAVNAFVCVVVLLPLGWYLAIHQSKGLGGLWFSMSVAWALATVGFGFVLHNLDLRKLRVIEGSA